MMAATPRRRRAWVSRHAPSAGGLSHRGDVQGLGVPPFVLALPIVEAAHLEGWVAVGTPTSRARGFAADGSTGRRARRAGTGGWGRGCRRRVAAWGSLGRCWPRGALWRRGRRHGHDPRGPLSGTPAVGLAVRALHSRYAATPRGDLRRGRHAAVRRPDLAPDSVHAVDAPTEDTAECDDHADGLRAQGVMTFAFALTPRELATSITSEGVAQRPLVDGDQVVTGFYCWRRPTWTPRSRSPARTTSSGRAGAWKCARCTAAEWSTIPDPARLRLLRATPGGHSNIPPDADARAVVGNKGEPELAAMPSRTVRVVVAVGFAAGSYQRSNRQERAPGRRPPSDLARSRAGARFSRCRRRVLHRANMPEKASFESP